MAQRSTDLLQEESHVYYLHRDRLGSLTEVTDEDKNVVGRARYDAYGRILSNTIPLTLTTRLYAWSDYDADTGLYKIGARWYDPQLGVWLTPDSIVPDVNNPIAWNGYAFNYQNPVNFVDPSGHIPIWDIADFASSLASFLASPGVGTAFDLFLDAVDLLPGVTGLGWGDEIAAGVARYGDDWRMAVSVGGGPCLESRPNQSVLQILELSDAYPLVFVDDVLDSAIAEYSVTNIFKDAGHAIPSNVGFVVGDAANLPSLIRTDIFVVAPNAGAGGVAGLFDVVKDSAAGWLGDKSRLIVASDLSKAGTLKGSLEARGLRAVERTFEGSIQVPVGVLKNRVTLASAHFGMPSSTLSATQPSSRYGSRTSSFIRVLPYSVRPQSFGRG